MLFRFHHILSFATIALLGLGAVPSDLAARNLGLLVGASHYPGGLPPLEGPRNDVQQIYELLLQRRFATLDIKVVADSLPTAFAQRANVRCSAALRGSGCPTADNILKALDDLARRADEGDFVYLHFSGHGVRVPDLVNPDEDDGTDEAFVPLDAGRWNAALNKVPRLVTDDDLRAALARIRAKGAFVWAVFDTCHSGTMTRGAARRGRAKWRKIRGRELDIPESAFERAQQMRQHRNTAAAWSAAPLELTTTPGGETGIVAFYAAQSGQLALEMGFPAKGRKGEKADGEIVMGALTHTLSRVLARNPGLTYRELARVVIDQYGQLQAPPPFFEGDLDKGVFGGEAARPDWRAEYFDPNLIDIDAGQLHGLNEGALVALSPIGAGQNGPVLHAEITRSWLLKSTARQLAGADRALVDAIANAPRLEARLEQPSVRFGLRVALPPKADRRAAKTAHAALRRLQRAGGVQHTPIDWVCDSCSADLYLRLTKGRIWLLNPYQDWVREGTRPSPSIAITAARPGADLLGERLWRAARTRNLLRVVSTTRETGMNDNRKQNLVVKTWLYRPDTQAALASEKRSCPQPVLHRPPQARLITSAMVPELYHCDIIYFEVVNQGDKPIDLTTLYVDSGAAITPFSFPGGERLGANGARRNLPIQIVTWDMNTSRPSSIGLERVVFIGVERDSDSAILQTFKHLAQGGLGTTRGAQKRSGSSPFAKLMDQAGLGAGAKTRSGAAPPPDDLQNITIHTYQWNVRTPGQ